MIENFRNLFTQFCEANLQRKSKSLLSTFDKTVKGLENVGLKAQKLASIKADQIKEKELETSKKIDKAKAAEKKAITRAEMKRFNKVAKADDSLVKAVRTKNSQIESLSSISEKNARVANKLKDLIS